MFIPTDVFELFFYIAVIFCVSGVILLECKTKYYKSIELKQILSLKSFFNDKINRFSNMSLKEIRQRLLEEFNNKTLPFINYNLRYSWAYHIGHISNVYTTEHFHIVINPCKKKNYYALCLSLHSPNLLTKTELKISFHEIGTCPFQHDKLTSYN